MTRYLVLLVVLFLLAAIGSCSLHCRWSVESRPALPELSETDLDHVGVRLLVGRAEVSALQVIAYHQGRSRP